MRPGRRAQLCILLIVLCVFAVFGRTVGHAFLYWDDHITLSGNADLNPPTLRSVASYWAKEKQDLYIPVTYAAWGALAAVGHSDSGLDPHVFHAANVVVHAIAACLAFALLRQLAKSDLAACVGALLFALHPVQVEPVAWTSGLKDVLCGALSLLAIWQYLLFASPDTGDVTRRRHYVVATAAYVLATLAKPSAVTVPIIAAALDLLLVRRDPRLLLRPLGPWVLVAIGVFLATRAAQPAAYVHDTPIWLRPIVAFDAVAWYLRHLVLPGGFAVDYGRAPQRVLPPDAATVGAWVALAMVLIACWALRRTWPWAAAGVAVLVLAVAPVLGFVRFDFQKYSTVADHYLYVAMLGPAIVIAAVIAGARRQRAVGAAFGILALTCGATSFQQAAHWRDTPTLFAHTLKVNPGSFAARNVLGYLAREKGNDVLASDHYVAALVIYPDDPTTNYNLGLTLLDLKQPARAAAHLERALAGEPQNPQYRSDYAVALYLSGRTDEAVKQLDTVLAGRPDFAPAIQNRARMRATSQPAP